MRGWRLGLIFVALSAFPAAGQGPLREGRSALRAGWLQQVEQARQRSTAFVGAAVDAFRLRDAKPRFRRAPSRPSDHSVAPHVPVGYLDDPTLRDGDVIAVPGKLIVFRGLPRLPHAPSDFEELGGTKARSGAHDRELRILGRALAREGPGDDGERAHASDRPAAR